MILWVAGGRDFGDWESMKHHLHEYATYGTLLVTGSANGADMLAENVWATYYQLPYVGVPAQWDAYGKPAGYMRNLNIAEGKWLSNTAGDFAWAKPDLLLVFPGGKGTAHAVKIAEEHGIVVSAPYHDEN